MSIKSKFSTNYVEDTTSYVIGNDPEDIVPGHVHKYQTHFLRFCANGPFVKFLAISWYCKIGQS